MRPSAYVAALIGATAAVSQVMASPPAAADGQAKILAIGTAVQFETRSALTTAEAAMAVGQPVELEVVLPVTIGDRIIIPAGVKAMANITSVRRKGMWGQSGGFTAQLAYLEQGGRHIRLNGSFTERGETGTAGVVASVELMPLAGFFVTGTSARLAPGARVTGFLGEPVTIDAPERDRVPEKPGANSGGSAEQKP